MDFYIDTDDAEQIELSVLHGFKVIAFPPTFFIYSHIFQDRSKKKEKVWFVLFSPFHLAL